jgi:hypothetical protein
MYIINGITGVAIPGATFSGLSNATANEYPIIVDVNNDDRAEIVGTGAGMLWVFSSNPLGQWAPSRKVWNQVPYNVVNVNEDLTIPAHPINPATRYPGPDGIVGNSDDLWPFNNFLQQQSILDTKGQPLWITPDATPARDLSYLTYTDSIITLTLAISNLGDASIGPQVYFTLYKDDTLGAVLKIDSANIAIAPGETKIVTTSYVDVAALNNPYVIAVRVNDRNRKFAYFAECDSTNNLIYLSLATKTATLNAVPHIGRYSNPVSVLGNEKIEYKLRASNPTKMTNQSIMFKDTLPAYVTLTTPAPDPAPVTLTDSTALPPRRQILTFVRPNVLPHGVATVTFSITPVDGVSASQPLFPNRAWATTYENSYPNPSTPTNYTYHQGAGVAMVFFSASLGGSIFGNTKQAVDYRSTALPGVIIAPDSGYIFVGWRHDAYTSMRGDLIPAADSIQHYDTLLIHGNVELYAVFAPAPQRPPRQIVTPPPSLSSPSSSPLSSDEKVWSHERTLYIQTPQSGSIVRIYTISGMLHDQRTLLTEGLTTLKLPPGHYIVTLNNGLGVKVAIK